MSGRRALRRTAPLAAGAEQTRGERDEATRNDPPVRRAQARSKENNPKPSAKKRARIYDSSRSLRQPKSAL